MKDGGWAFPAAYQGHYFEGMTLRDYYAGQALPEVMKAIREFYYLIDGDADSRWLNENEIDKWLGRAAELSYRQADFVLAERDKTSE